MDDKYVYHGSKVTGLTEISPKEGTQLGKYVYATDEELIALIFSSRHKGGTFAMSIGLTGSGESLKYMINERIPNAFDCYLQPVSIYQLDATNFERFEEFNWANKELRSPKTEPVVKESRYDNCLSRLQEYEKKGMLEIIYFPNKAPHVPIDDSDLVSKAFKIYEVKGRNDRVIESLSQYHPNLKPIVDIIYSNVVDLPDTELHDYIKNMYDEKNKCLNPSCLEVKKR